MDFSKWAFPEYGLLGFSVASLFGLAYLFVQYVWPEMVKRKNEKAADNSGGKDALQKIGEKAVDKFFSEEQQDAKEFMGAMVNVLKHIEEELLEARKERESSLIQTQERLQVVTDTIQGLKKSINIVTEKSLMSIIYNPTARPLDRMINLKEYFQRGKDGSCLEFAVKDVIQFDPDSWHAVVNQTDGNEIVNEEAYKESLKKVDAELEKLKLEKLKKEKET